MREAGVDLFADSRDLAVVGLTEVISHWKPIRAAFHRAVEELRDAPPDLLLLIDYPDFNLRLASRASSVGVPVVYFIGPQVWAWRKSRLQAIAWVLLNKTRFGFDLRATGMSQTAAVAFAIGVASAYPVTIARMAEWAASANARGFHLVPVSAFAGGPADSPKAPAQKTAATSKR
jgi:ribose/xylose/arabinose/galactoside ABC-type transport system permease subunit